MKIEFHHINCVSKDVEGLDLFYRDILQMQPIPAQQFVRTEATQVDGYDGKIKFVTEGSMQMHLAEKDLNVAAKNKRHINPVENGHIAFRTDDITAFKAHLDAHGIPFADYGTTFSQQWHQIFFHDPEGNVIEVHQELQLQAPRTETMQEQRKAVPLRAGIEPSHNTAAKFAVISRYIPKDGFVEDIVQSFTDAPLSGALSQHMLVTHDNQILTIAFFDAAYDGHENAPVRFSGLESLSDKLVGFPNGGLLEVRSGPVVFDLYIEENARRLKDEMQVLSVVRFKVKTDCTEAFLENIQNFPLGEDRIRRSVVQTGEREFIAITRDPIEAKIALEPLRLQALDGIEHLLEWFDDSRTDPRSGVVHHDWVRQ